MTTVAGLSAFGLRDCTVFSDDRHLKRGFQLAQVLLPENSFERLQTGERAEQGRVHTGLHWPLEARIAAGQPLRRVPVSCAWKALVDAGDRMGRWHIGNGVSFPLSKILATYINDVLLQPLAGESDIRPVLAIPNHLDELGQENLLNEMRLQGFRKAMLIWRPVAIALSWLEKVQNDFVPKRMHPDDHIHIIYLGSDAIELTTLRLRSIKHNGLHYIVPLRDRPADARLETGLDWVAKLIESVYPSLDAGEFWQLYSVFSDFWESAAGIERGGNSPLKPWSSAGKWSLWKMPVGAFPAFLNIATGHSESLRQLLSSSCESFTFAKKDSPETIKDFLNKKLDHMARSFPSGALKGLIISGPLAQPGVPVWLSESMHKFKPLGLDYSGDPSTASIHRPWICPQCTNPVAEGAMIFGNRIAKGIPAYLDTMPQVNILAQENARYLWVPLLNAQEVLGGQEHYDTIRGRFMLGKDMKKLDVYLYKGSNEEADRTMKEVSEAIVQPSEAISPCMARLVRYAVRELGSYERVQANSFFKGNGLLAHYGNAFAKSIYLDHSAKQGPLSTSILLEKTAFRLSRVHFPSSPSENVVLDIDVRMRPASGLAKVEILPQKSEFLHGRRVRLDYGKMRTPEKLPIYNRGWPRLQEIVVDPEDENLCNQESFIERFEALSPADPGYNAAVDRLRDYIIRRSLQKVFFGTVYYLQSIDQNGAACSVKGNLLVARISDKLGKDFKYFFNKQMTSSMNKVFTRAAWLYFSTPAVIVDYISDLLQRDLAGREWRWAADAAGRCFREVGQFNHLFRSIALRITQHSGVEAFPIEAARGIWRVLMLRPDGQEGLNRQLANVFAKATLNRLLMQQDMQNFNNLYFQLIRLLLYLLRIRKSDPSCFDPNDKNSIKVFEKSIESMERAKRYFHNRDNTKATKVSLIADGFNKYLNYEGSEDLLTLLGEAAGGLE